jgi:hypothetical protein
VKKETWIRPETGLPPGPGESTDGLVLQEKMFYQDPLTNNYCADCARATNEEGKVQYEQNMVNEVRQESNNGNNGRGNGNGNGNSDN